MNCYVALKKSFLSFAIVEKERCRSSFAFGKTHNQKWVGYITYLLYRRGVKLIFTKGQQERYVGSNQVMFGNYIQDSHHSWSMISNREEGYNSANFTNIELKCNIK